jgi:hypothetical protein
VEAALAQLLRTYLEAKLPLHRFRALLLPYCQVSVVYVVSRPIVFCLLFVRLRLSSYASV